MCACIMISHQMLNIIKIEVLCFQHTLPHCIRPMINMYRECALFLYTLHSFLSARII